MQLIMLAIRAIGMPAAGQRSLCNSGFLNGGSNRLLVRTLSLAVETGAGRTTRRGGFAPARHFHHVDRALDHAGAARRQ